MFLLPFRCLMMMAFQDSSVIDVFAHLTGLIFSERLVMNQTFFFLNITSHHLFGIQHILRWNVTLLHQVDRTVVLCIHVSHNTFQPTQSLLISCTNRRFHERNRSNIPIWDKSFEFKGKVPVKVNYGVHSGLVLRQGYVPENIHANRTRNSL
jgi:hypothetical protein